MNSPSAAGHSYSRGALHESRISEMHRQNNQPNHHHLHLGPRYLWSKRSQGARLINQTIITFTWVPLHRSSKPCHKRTQGEPCSKRIQGPMRISEVHWQKNQTIITSIHGMLKLIAKNHIDFKFARQALHSTNNTSLILLKTVQNSAMELNIVESNDAQVWFPLH